MDKEKAQELELACYLGHNRGAAAFAEMKEMIEQLESALREIDTHIRATSEPVPHIIETLKKTLPEYQD